MYRKFALPVLATLHSQGPSPVAGGEPGVALHRRDWQAFEGLHGSLGALDDPTILLITGADERIRAEVATGLGTAAAIGGRRTLVMECDLARPVLADMVGLDHLPGLREYLSWAAGAPDLLQPVSLAGLATEGKDSVGQLIFITAGRPAANGAALLATDSLSAAMAKVSRAYELVIVISGPLPSPELFATAAEADAMLVCAGPTMVGGEGEAAIIRSLGRLPGLPVGLVVHQRS